MTVDEVAVRPSLVGGGHPTQQWIGRSLVAWQHPESRLIAPVGLLEHEDGLYRFRYLRRAARVPDFQAFVGFSDLTRRYESVHLFPIFAQRIMSRKRPDYERYLRQLHLGSDASPWEQMVRSEGRRTGDTVQVFPVPTVDNGRRTTCSFLVHGVRYFNDGVVSLRPGDRLTLRDEPGNPVNSDAVRVCASDGAPVGYVPDLLLEHLQAMRSAGPVELIVEHTNGTDAPPHLRLLVRLDGHVPHGYQPMAGPQWETFED